MPLVTMRVTPSRITHMRASEATERPQAQSQTVVTERSGKKGDLASG